MIKKPTYKEIEQRVRELEKAESERKLTEEALLEKETKFRLLTEGMNDILWTADLGMNTTYLSPSIEKVLGFTVEERLKHSLQEQMPPETFQLASERLAEEVEFDGERDPKRYTCLEIDYYHKDGSLRCLETSLSFIRDEHGKPVGIHGISRDITERKQAEEELRRERERLVSILEGTQIGTWEWNVQTGKIIFNERWAEIIGYSLEEISPVSLETWRKFAHPDDLKNSEELLQRHFSGELHYYECEARMRHKNGEWVWVLDRGKVAVWTEDGKPLYIMGTHQDITERKQMEEALKVSEERLRLAMSVKNEGIWDWNLVTNETFFDERYYTMAGYTNKEFPQNFKAWAERVHPEDLPNAEAAIQAYLSGQSDRYDIEFRFRHKEGYWMWIQGRSKIVKLDESGVPLRMIGTHTDITERKQAEEELKSNYALLQIAGETAKFGGWNVDLENNTCKWSDAVADIHDVPHGYAPPVQEAINFYAPEWREKITQIFSACTKEGIPYDEEMEIITQEGKRVWVRTTGKAVKNEKDRIIKVQGSFQDITDRKQTEQALVEQKDLLAAIYRNAPLVIMVVNAERRIQQINGFAAQFAGRDAEEMLDLRGGEALRCMHVLDDPRGCGFGKLCQQCVIRNTVLDTLETGKTHFQIEAPYYFKGQDKETRELQILMSTTPIEVKGERMVLVTLQDITEHKQAEAEKEKLQAQLAQAQKMESVGRLAGGVAHDFNNMLGVILGHVEFALEEAEKNQNIYSDLKEIQKAAKRSADTTKQLLAFARKEIISPKQIDLNDTVESMLNMLRRLIGEHIDLVWQPAACLWPVKMDPSQIDQILANLCVNARDAISGVGTLTIETGKQTFDEKYCSDHPGFIPGDFVLLAVSDNGCGMDKDTQDNLFEPFFTTKEVGKGTGLGLATIYGIVKQNNGFINVYSEPDQGSTFKIYLPRLVADEDADKTVSEKKTAAGGTETILLVEDEHSILRMIQMMLKRKGYTVLSASTPTEAFEKAKNHSGSIDLLMTDVIMPEMHGRSLAEKITDIYPDIRLLFMSGYTADVIAHQGVLDDRVAFIQKPFSMANLAEKLREVLETASDKT